MIILYNTCLISGYDLNQVNVYIGKVFENVGSLLFEEVEDNEKYHFMITGVNSVLGEKIEFLQVYYFLLLFCFLCKIIYIYDLLIYLIFRDTQM